MKIFVLISALILFAGAVPTTVDSDTGVDDDELENIIERLIGFNTETPDLVTGRDEEVANMDDDEEDDDTDDLTEAIVRDIETGDNEGLIMDLRMVRAFKNYRDKTLKPALVKIFKEATRGVAQKVINVISRTQGTKFSCQLMRAKKPRWLQNLRKVFPSVVQSLRRRC